MGRLKIKKDLNDLNVFFLGGERGGGCGGDSMDIEK